MSFTIDALLLAAALAAGTINSIVGSGSMITFFALVSVGYSPVSANMVNAVGLWPGAVSGTVGYRRELPDRLAIRVLVLAALVGALCGGALLLTVPREWVKVAVPILVAVATILIAVQPRLSQLRRRPSSRLVLICGVFAAGLYGGFFLSGIGVVFLAVLGLLLPAGVQAVNATKMVLASVVNIVTAVLFAATAEVSWSAAALIAIGGIVGGLTGARLARALPEALLRGIVVAIGTITVGALIAMA